MRSMVALMLLVLVAGFTTAQDAEGARPEVSQPVTAASEKAAVQPALAADADGKLYLAYGVQADSTQIYLRASADAGSTWSEPELVSDGADKVMAGNTRGPRIALIDGTIVITAFAVFRKGDDAHLYCFRKSAKDKQFKAARVSDPKAKDMECLHDMCVDSKGNIHVVWLDARSGGAEPYYATSSNEGKSFKGETAVYTSPTGGICPCCAPSIAAEGKTVVVQFRNKLLKLGEKQAYNDMHTAVSTDGGRKWNVKRLDNRERWKG
ncbi:MAG: exo-alpha-sialidase [Planctomycetes bacterium]|nr:exo-alpha-sialidase [Planctomycetota bacterium]